MSVRPEALRVARRWIAKAEEDIAAAERLLSLDDSLAAVAFARTHDLIQLFGLLPSNLALPIPLEDLAPLNRYAVEARYPIGEEPLTGEEAREAVAVARRVHALAHDAVRRVAPPG